MSNKLLRFLISPEFLLMDLLGFLALGIAFFVSDPLRGVISAIGTTGLTIGLSLPVALFYQQKWNAEASQILAACHQAEIKAFFVSRDKDRPKFRAAVGVAFAETRNIDLLGVAFYSIFNPRDAYHPEVK